MAEFPTPLVAYTKETVPNRGRGAREALLSTAGTGLSMELGRSANLEDIAPIVARQGGVEAARYLLSHLILQESEMSVGRNVINMADLVRQYLEAPTLILQDETKLVDRTPMRGKGGKARGQGAKRGESKEDKLVDTCIASSALIVDLVSAACEMGINGIDILPQIFANNPNLNALDLALYAEPWGIAHDSNISVALTILSRIGVRMPNVAELYLRTKSLPRLDRKSGGSKIASQNKRNVIVKERGKRDSRDPGYYSDDLSTPFGNARYIATYLVSDPLSSVISGIVNANKFEVNNKILGKSRGGRLGWELVQFLVPDVIARRGIDTTQIQQLFLMMPDGTPVYYCCKKGRNEKINGDILKEYLRTKINEVAELNAGKSPSDRGFKTVPFRDMGDYVELLVSESIPQNTVAQKLEYYRGRVKAGTTALGRTGVVAFIKDENLKATGLESIAYRTVRGGLTRVTYKLMGNLYEGVVDTEGYLHLPMGLSQKVAETIELITLSHLMDIKNPRRENITEGVADAKIQGRARGAVSSRPYLRSEQFGFIPNIDEVVSPKGISFTRDELTANDFDGCSLVELNRVLVRCLMDNKYLDSLGQSQPELASRISEKVKLIISRIDAKGVGATWQEARDGSKTLVMGKATKDTLVGRLGDKDQHQEKIRGFLDRIGLSSDEIRQYFESNIPYFFVNYVEESNPDNSSKPIQVVCANAGRRLFEESV